MSSNEEEDRAKKKKNKKHKHKKKRDSFESVDIIKKRHGYSYLASNDDSELYEPVTTVSASSTTISTLPTNDIAKVKEELQCAACHDLLFEPVLLACGHSFCRPCIKNAFLFAAHQPGEVGATRRCISCRANLCGCTLKLPISYVLWNTIKLLFPAEVASRTREIAGEMAELRRSCKGENGGRHELGFEVIVNCAKEQSDWQELGSKLFRAKATRSIILDDQDQSRDIALSFNMKVVNDAKRRKFLKLDDEVEVSISLLNCEEDEATELPIAFTSSDDLSIGEHGDECLLFESHPQTSLSVTVSAVDFSWTGQVEMIKGKGSFRLHLGNEPGEHLCSIVDSHSGAELRFVVPIAPVGWKQKVKSKVTSDSEGSPSEEGSEEDSEDLDEYEEDGFLVMEGEEDDEGDDTCEICGETTIDCGEEVLLCDGCGLEFHMGCAGLLQVPDDDWFCIDCKPMKKRAVEMPIEEDDDVPSPVHHKRLKKGKANTQLLSSDSE